MERHSTRAISPDPCFLLLPLSFLPPASRTTPHRPAMSSSSAAAALAVRFGVWDGSELDDDTIEHLRKMRRLPGANLVRAAPRRWGK